MTRPRGILSCLQDAAELARERGCSFGEALAILHPREPEPEPETNVIQFRLRGADGMA